MAWKNGYKFRRTITVDHTKCGSGNSTDFPVLVNGTYTYLKTLANGGLVTNNSGYDIIFTSDAAGQTPLFWEIEGYAPTTGLLIFWVKIPTISSSADTVFYMFYGNTTISTFQSTATSVWNSSTFALVWHLPNGATLTALDSTIYGFNGTLFNTPAALTAQIGGGAGLTAASSQYIKNASTPNFTNGSFTLELWFKQAGSPGITNEFITAYADGSTPVHYTEFKIDTSEAAGSRYKFSYFNGTTLVGLLASETVPIDGNWHHLAVAVVASTSITLYVDGASVATTSTGVLAAFSVSGAPFTVGAYISFGPGGYLNGSVDEARVSLVARNADWLLTEFNNQNSPSTFYAISGQATNVADGFFGIPL